MNPYPLTFVPILKERIWGGSRLGTVLGKNVHAEGIGESWEISGVPGDVSVVANGPLKGKSLDEVLQSDPRAWLGKKVVDAHGKNFPILIKFIDAAKDLSIQVHPDDQLAGKRHNSFGKNEMWYIMDADKDARLILGFKEKVKESEYLKHLDQDTLPNILKAQPVQPGEAFFIHAGMIHAIGGGILLAEIQQTSDVTYRLYDYNRRDSEGNTRELHTEQALEAIDFDAVQPKPIQYKAELNTVNAMVETPYFTTNFVPVKGQMALFKSQRDAFTIVMGIKGAVSIGSPEGEVTIKAGQTVLLPATTQSVILKADYGEVLDISI